MSSKTALPVRAEQPPNRLTASQRDARSGRLAAPRKNSHNTASNENKSLSRIPEGSDPAPESIVTSKRAPDVAIESHGDEVHLTFDGGRRRYRVRGLEHNHSSQQLRVNLLAIRDERVHMDTLDLCKARCRSAFIRAAASELVTDADLIKRDIGTMLLALEEIQYERIERATRTQAPPEPDEAERAAALELLTDPNLAELIVRDLDETGLAGEQDAALLAYLACVSRRLDHPLALLVQSGSAAGKTTLMDAVLELMPPEDVVRYSALTGQALYYVGGGALRHKILAIAEEQGVAQAAYALKLLQSDRRLSIAAVGKHGPGGRPGTETYTVEGPVMMFLTTTSEQPDPELHNRCLTLRINESSRQTAAIHARQREVWQGNHPRIGRERESILAVHRTAQRMLEPLKVVMPWAHKLTFRHDQTRMRRDHAKYLSLIAVIALLHQYQRKRVEVRGAFMPAFATASGLQPPACSTAIEATLADVALANRLLTALAGQSLDELLPQTRQLLELIDDRVSDISKEQRICRSRVRFTQRSLRESLGWSDFQVRHHLRRLVEMEFVVAHRTGVGNGREYQLLYEGQGQDGTPFLLGLADPESLAPQIPVEPC